MSNYGSCIGPVSAHRDQYVSLRIEEPLLLENHIRIHKVLLQLVNLLFQFHARTIYVHKSHTMREMGVLPIALTTLFKISIKFPLSIFSKSGKL